MLELRSVSYRYAGARRDAVRDCSLRVERGERVALVGRNGSGKSTLLSLCKGGVSPSSGEILVDGVSAGRDGARLLQEGVGILRQDPRGQLVSSLVEEELAFGSQNLGIGGEELGRRVREALRLCGVEDLARSRTMGLSGGQMQRVALAAVLAMGPSYLMLDEPCAQLDPRARQGIRSSLAVLAGRGVGMLLASHLPEDIASADRVLVMEAGRICWEGRPLELFSDAALLARAGVLGDSADALNALARRGATGGSCGRRHDLARACRRESRRRVRAARGPAARRLWSCRLGERVLGGQTHGQAMRRRGLAPSGRGRARAR